MGNRRDLSGAITISIMLLLIGSGLLPQVAAQSSQLPTSIRDMIATRAESDALAGKPLSVSDFSRLLEDDLTKAQLSVREAFEHYETTYNAARAGRPWWQSVKDLVPNLGWIVGAIALAYAVFKTQIETALKATVDWVVQAIYGRVAGYRIFWWTGLRRYRRALAKKYQNVTLLAHRHRIHPPQVLLGEGRPALAWPGRGTRERTMMSPSQTDPQKSTGRRDPPRKTR